jgi:hypothetical protein
MKEKNSAMYMTSKVQKEKIYTRKKEKNEKYKKEKKKKIYLCVK